MLEKYQKNVLNFQDDIIMFSHNLCKYLDVIMHFVYFNRFLCINFNIL